MIREYLTYIPLPDFLQALLVLTAFLILPLEHKKGWKKNFAAAVAVAFFTGGLVTLLTINYFPIGITAKYITNTIIYFGLPMTMSFLFFKICTTISNADAFYGVGLAYMVQHIMFCISTIVWGQREPVSAQKFGEIQEQIRLIESLRDWALILILGGLFCAFLGKRLPVHGHYRVSDRKAFVTLGMVLVIALVLNFWVRLSITEEERFVFIICLIYDVICCTFLLWLQAEQRREVNLLATVETERQVHKQTMEQYQISKENIDIINKKCHDLKHQISALRFIDSSEEREKSLQEIEKSVIIYDAATKTGNEVLDTVLTEKALLCEKNCITWTCMADGTVLDFMPPVDLYSMMGNILDNAIESSQSVKELEKRVVSVNIRNEHNAAVIQVENYFNHPIKITDGVLETTKSDSHNHGFGIRSIQSIVERFGGTMDIDAENHIFLLSILIPLR